MKIVTSKGKTIVSEDIFQVLSVILIVCICVQGYMFLNNNMQLENIAMTGAALLISLYFGFRKGEKDEQQEN